MNRWEVAKFILTLAGLLFTGWQVLLYRKDFEKRNQRLQIEKAVEMAGFYREKIIPYLDVIVSVFQMSKLDAYKESKVGDFIEFNTKELNENFEKKDIECFINSINMPVRLESKPKEPLWPNEHYLVIKNYLQLNCSSEHLSGCITELLNLLEEFSMYFVTEIADEETVYQSLHQSFRSAIKLLYIFIATRNYDEKNKYYTNTVELFKLWDQRYKDKEHIEAENKMEQQEMQKNQKSVVHPVKKLKK